jgi:predicted transposase/invertase (TIGR01784 family)
MLYAFASKFLSGEELDNMKEMMEMTELGQRLMKEWSEEAMQKGILVGKIETAKEMLKEGDSIDKVVRITKLSIEKVEQLQLELQLH